MSYDNNLTGVLFPNDKKQKDTHPDFKGSVEVNGAHFWVSGWKGTSKKDGKPYMSLKLEPKDQQQNYQQQADKSYDEMNPPPVQDEKDYFGF